MADVKSRHLEISAADSSTHSVNSNIPDSRKQSSTRNTSKRKISPPSSLLSGNGNTSPDSEDGSFGLAFVDDDGDPDFLPSKKKRTGDFQTRHVHRTGIIKKDHARADSDGGVDKGEISVSDSDEDALVSVEIERLLEKLCKTGKVQTEESSDVDGEDAESPPPPKKWNHFLIPLEGALKHLPFYPFKKLWHKLYEDPGFEVSTNGECLLYNGKDQRNGFLKSVRYVNPVNKKCVTTSLQKVILMLACGCAELPLEMIGNTVCFNVRCIAIEHISLEPPYMQHDRWACFERGRCSRHYDPDEHRHFPDCRIDLTSKGAEGHQNVDDAEAESNAVFEDHASDISLSESEAGS